MLGYSMYQRLLMLPVFNGLTTDELTVILSYLHVDINHYEEGDVIVQQGDRCDKFIFVLSGTLDVEYTSPDGLFYLKEAMNELTVLEPWNVYGMRQKFERSYSCATAVDSLTVSKNEFNNVMMQYKVTRSNIMNMCCAKLQNITRLLHEYEPETVSEKMLRFIQCNSATTKGSKTLMIKMEDFAYIIKETRLNVSNAIRDFKNAGLLGPSRRGGIEILDINEFIKYVKQ